MKSSKSKCVSYPDLKMSCCCVTGSRSLTNTVLSCFGKTLEMCGVPQLNHAPRVGSASLSLLFMVLKHKTNKKKGGVGAFC